MIVATKVGTMVEGKVDDGKLLEERGIFIHVKGNMYDNGVVPLVVETNGHDGNIQDDEKVYEPVYYVSEVDHFNELLQTDV